MEKYHTAAEIADKLGVSKPTFNKYLGAVIEAYSWMSKDNFVRGTGRNTCYTQFAAEMVESYAAAQNKIAWVEQVRLKAPKPEPVEPELVEPQTKIQPIEYIQPELVELEAQSSGEIQQITLVPQAPIVIQQINFVQVGSDVNEIREASIQTAQSLRQTMNSFASHLINTAKAEGRAIGAVAYNEMVAAAAQEIQLQMSQSSQIVANQNHESQYSPTQSTPNQENC